MQKVKEGTGNFGFNAATSKYEDLVAAGVIDPVKVVRSALQNASSVASLMLTTEALIAEKPKRRSRLRAAVTPTAAWAAATSDSSVSHPLATTKGGFPAMGAAFRLFVPHAENDGGEAQTHRCRFLIRRVYLLRWQGPSR